MPRPKKPGAPEPKRRSRKGCWPCKARKVKCGEEKPSCLNCQRQGETCDYSIRLNWEGRTRQKHETGSFGLPSSGPVAGVLSFQDRTQEQVDSTSVVEQSEASVHAQEQNAKLCIASSHVAWDPGAPGNLGQNTIFAQRLQGASSSPPAVLERPPPNEKDCGSTADQEPDPFTPSWTGQISRQSELSREAMAQYQSSIFSPCRTMSDLSFDTNFPSATMAPLSGLNISGNFVSQPISFLRQSPAAQGQSPASSSFDDDGLPDRLAKRIKLSTYPFNSTTIHNQTQDGSQMDNPGNVSDIPFFNAPNVHTHALPHLRQNIPLSPTSSSPRSDDMYAKVVNKSLASLNSSVGLRRVSVNSLLSQSAEFDGESEPISGPGGSDFKRHVRSASVTDNYGLDFGYPDLDLNKNNDNAAIESISSLDEISRPWEIGADAESSEEKSITDETEAASAKGDYYANPVPINIPRYLTPLPSTLLGNPINLMYFHHFLNHTARILVPHDCFENPFVSVMPSMAIADPNLLNLLLAYSASHRARYLCHPEPANRIAHWVSDVFPTLRRALNDPHQNVTDRHLATAIMLLSLKIVSPSTFEVPIPWQSHLKLARDLFVARKEHQLAHPGNKIGFFLARWIAYLDILGGLSCRHSDPPLFEGQYWPLAAPGCPVDEDDEFRVDCFLGFTPRTQTYLSRLSELAHRCDNEHFDEMGTFCTDWSPSTETVRAAESLLHDMYESRQYGHARGTHHDDVENQETISIDRAFHWSGVLHLHRRVLGTSPDAPQVKESLGELLDALRQIRTGTSAEVSVLFPLFTAGCVAQDTQQRVEIMQRIKGMEGAGLKQIQNARKLMQRCWDEDLPWIALAQGEFLG